MHSSRTAASASSSALFFKNSASACNQRVSVLARARGGQMPHIQTAILIKIDQCAQGQDAREQVNRAPANVHVC